MIKNIVFDLGNVLITYNPYEYILAMGYEEEKAKKLLDAIFLDSLWLDMDKGIYESYIETVELFVEKNPELETDIRDFFAGEWMSIYQLIAETEDLYNRLFEQGYKIYILSNFAKDGFAYVEEKYAFISKAHGRIISSHVQQVKPEADIYQTLLNRYQLKPKETVFLDDMPRNIAGAKETGMHGILFTDLEKATKQLNELIEQEKNR